MQHQFVISEVALCDESSYFPLLKELRHPIKKLNKIQTVDNECFRWYLVRYLNRVNKNFAKSRNVDEQLAKQFGFTDVNFHIFKKTMLK